MSMFQKSENQCQYQCHFSNFREINVNANVNTPKKVNVNTCFNTIAHACCHKVSIFTREKVNDFLAKVHKMPKKWWLVGAKTIDLPYEPC